jgi:MFS family permease
MSPAAVRLGLYMERLLVSLSTGIFALLPLYFVEQGRNEVFFAQIFAAGAVSTLVVVALSSYLIKCFGLRKLAPSGAALYGLGAALFVSSTTLDDWSYVVASLLLGAGWGLEFTYGSICLSSTVKEENRSYYFNIYAAFSQLGVGMGPLVCSFLQRYLDSSFHQLFALAFILCFIGFAISLYVSMCAPFYGDANIPASSSTFGDFIVVIRSDSFYFCVMVMLGACVYSTMINLQTTYARASQVPYEVFYFFYAMSVVISRFSLGKTIAAIPPSRAIGGLLILMILSLLVLLQSGQSWFLYGSGAVLVGISYGLVYPIVQGEASNRAAPSLRTQTLALFSLFYFIAVYLFPYAGALIAVNFGYRALIVGLIVISAAELLVALVYYGKKSREVRNAIRTTV